MEIHSTHPAIPDEDALSDATIAAASLLTLGVNLCRVQRSMGEKEFAVYLAARGLSARRKSVYRWMAAATVWKSLIDDVTHRNDAADLPYLEILLRHRAIASIEVLAHAEATIERRWRLYVGACRIGRGGEPSCGHLRRAWCAACPDDRRTVDPRIEKRKEAKELLLRVHGYLSVCDPRGKTRRAALYTLNEAIRKLGLSRQTNRK